jgi:hypothetical protein
MNKLFTLLVVIVTLSAYSQRTCHTNNKVNEYLAEHPEFAAYHQEVMDYIRNTENTNIIFNRGSNSTTAVVTIPVVFHVLYKNATENISDAQINSQLDVLNKDFRKLNTDFNTVVPAAFRPFAADLEIVFCKATKTPTGATTTGITRKAVNSSFDLYNNYFTSSGEPAWNTSKYLNIWIGRFNDSTLLGFALPPSFAGQNRDGLCIGDQFFGTTGTASSPYNKGRTATHEIGHYFGLYHMWGDSNDPTVCGTAVNSDEVADTPATDTPYFGCPTFPTNTNACTSTTNGSMFMNYMDYVNDACMGFFTAGQKLRTQSTLSGPRLSLLSSTGCASLGLSDFEAQQAIAVYPNPASKYFMITSPQVSIDEVQIFNTVGQLVKTQKLTQTNNEINIEDLASGTYYLRIYNQGEFLKSDKIIKK